MEYLEQELFNIIMNEDNLTQQELEVLDHYLKLVVNSD